MAEHDERSVSPDDNLLLQIFRDKQPDTTTIVLQTWDKCVFRADFDSASEDCSSVFVRLESAGDASTLGLKPSAPLLSLSAVAAMQEIARTCLPDLVPKTLQVGAKEARHCIGCLLFQPF